MPDQTKPYSKVETLLREIGVPLIGSDPAEIAGKSLHPTYSPGDLAVDQEGLERLVATNPAGAVKIIERLVEHVAILRRSETAERETSEKYKLALRGADLGMWEWFPQIGLNMLDEEGHRILGYARGEVSESSAGFENMVHPDDRQLVVETMMDHLQGNAPIWECEYRIITRSEDFRWVLSRGKTCEWDKEGKPWRVIGAFIDITDRKHMEARLESSLKEREALLREMHHRVKNNFAAVVSLLRTQANRIKDADLVTLFKEAEFRVKCMGFVHDKLHKSETLDSIKIRDYLGSVLHALEDTYAAGQRGILVQKDIEELSLSVDTAIPLGFISSELCSNCLKHAFPNGRRGQIKILLRALGQTDLELVVSDDGVGIPETTDFENLDTLGLRLVDGFVRQLDGKLSLDSGPGTRARVTFRNTERFSRIHNVH